MGFVRQFFNFNENFKPFLRIPRIGVSIINYVQIKFSVKISIINYSKFKTLLYNFFKCSLDMSNIGSYINEFK